MCAEDHVDECSDGRAHLDADNCFKSGALAHAMFFLPTPDACKLSCSCVYLQATFALPDKSAYLPQNHAGAWGSYDNDYAWLHLLVDLQSAISCAKQLRQVQIKGPLEFQSNAEIELVTSMLAHKVSGRSSYSFAVSWVFNRNRIRELLHDGSTGTVLSKPVRFRCAYGVTFEVTLGASKSRASGTAVELRLESISFQGNYLAAIDVCVSGIIPAMQAIGIEKAHLNPLRWNSQFEGEKETTSAANDRRPDPAMFDDNMFHGGTLKVSGTVLSLLCIDVPKWCTPVTVM